MSVSVNNVFYQAEELVNELLGMDSVREFLRKHGITRTRSITVRPDPSHEGYFQIPVYDHGPSSRFVTLFRPAQNPAQEIKRKIQELLMRRRGYAPGDVFVTPWGRFLVNDALGLKEI